MRLLIEPTWKMKMKMRETVKSVEWRVEENQDNNTMRMIHLWRARKTPWANVMCDIEMCAVKHEKMWRVRVFCSHPVGCSRLLSAVNDLTKIPLWVSWWVRVQNRSPCSLRLLISGAQRYLTFFNIWASPVFILLPPWGTRWRRWRMPPFYIDTKELVQVAILQIHGGDGAYF